MLMFGVILAIIASFAAPVIARSTQAPESGQFSTADTQGTELPGISFCDLQTSNATTCTLLKTDGLIEVNYKSDVDGMVSLMSYMPHKLTGKGNCEGDASSNMRIAWPGYSLYWQLSKSSDEKHWYISYVELTVSSEKKYFSDLKMVDKTFKLINKQMHFPTPVGKSFSCEDLLTVVELDSPDPNLHKQGLRGFVFLRDFRLQPCLHKGDSFGPPHKC